MNNSIPVVSIMMPAYNAGKYISATLDSIIAQTYTNWELICYDDGSTDDTVSIVRRYQDSDDRIKLYVGQHGGRGKARNEVLKHCRGEFIAVCDADDISLPSRFQQQVDFLYANPSISAVGSNLIPFHDAPDESNTKIILWPETHESISARFDKLRMAMSNCSVMIRAACFKEVGGFDEALLRCQDFGFFIKLHKLGHKFYNIQEPLVYYRQDGRIPSYKYWLESEYFHDLAISRADNSLSSFNLSPVVRLKLMCKRSIPWVRYAFFYIKRLRDNSL